MPSADENRFERAPAIRSNPFQPYVGEGVMRIVRLVVAVVFSVLALFAVPATAALADPGMTHNGTEMTHN